jgi:hypothetical protein
MSEVEFLLFTLLKRRTRSRERVPRENAFNIHFLSLISLVFAASLIENINSRKECMRSLTTTESGG